jgi:nitrite reductase/ring-hydroxylating ferredoxin subunit
MPSAEQSGGADAGAGPLALAATYRREVAASLARVWENVHDWEHLPWLHGSSFAAVELLGRGPAGWRVRLVAQPGDPARAQVVELVADEPAHHYRVVTRDGPGTGSEIRVRLEPRAPHVTGVVVEFHVPAMPADKLARVGEIYVELYRRLWDEDEVMMIARERACTRAAARSPSTATVTDLGPEADVRARLPLVVELGGERFRLLDLDGALVAHAATCPHWLGPLADATLRDGCVTCPWHGYRFDVRTGASADGRGLRLAPAPSVVIERGRVVLHPAE